MSETLLAYLAPLKGRTIRGVALSPDGFPVLRLDNGWDIEVSQDPEGNGPGFLFGLPCLSKETDPLWKD